MINITLRDIGVGFLFAVFYLNADTSVVAQVVLDSDYLIAPSNGPIGLLTLAGGDLLLSEGNLTVQGRVDALGGLDLGTTTSSVSAISLYYDAIPKSLVFASSDEGSSYLWKEGSFNDPQLKMELGAGNILTLYKSDDGLPGLIMNPNSSKITFSGGGASGIYSANGQAALKFGINGEVSFSASPILQSGINLGSGSFLNSGGKIHLAQGYESGIYSPSDVPILTYSDLSKAVFHRDVIFNDGAQISGILTVSKGLMAAGGTMDTNMNPECYGIALLGGSVLGQGGGAAIGQSARAHYGNTFATSNSDSVGLSSVALSGGDSLGSYSTAMSAGEAYGAYSVAGANGYAVGEYSTSLSLGYSAGVNSVALSYGYATEYNSTAASEGNAYGETSVALARGTTLGLFSFGTGQGSVAEGMSAVALGTYNKLATVTPSPYFAGESDAIFTVGNGKESSRSSAMETQRNGRTLLTNKYWSASNPTAIPLNAAEASQGNGLVVEGHMILKGNAKLEGNVTMDRPQGDISMGIFGDN